MIPPPTTGPSHVGCLYLLPSRPSPFTPSAAPRSPLSLHPCRAARPPRPPSSPSPMIADLAPSPPCPARPPARTTLRPHPPPPPHSPPPLPPASAAREPSLPGVEAGDVAPDQLELEQDALARIGSTRTVSGRSKAVAATSSRPMVIAGRPPRSLTRIVPYPRCNSGPYKPRSAATAARTGRLLGPRRRDLGAAAGELRPEALDPWAPDESAAARPWANQV